MLEMYSYMLWKDLTFKQKSITFNHYYGFACENAGNVGRLINDNNITFVIISSIRVFSIILPISLPPVFGAVLWIQTILVKQNYK